jgi:UDP-N-acetylglucosamine 4,6-dehydratase
MIKGEKIFITGGAGYLGKNLVERLYKDNEITIFSRDEAKHYFLKKKFPNIKCIIGDVRNYPLLKKSSIGHSIGIFAASIKHIQTVDQNVQEGLEIIINGAINSRKAAEENNMKAACFISTDKSRAATTLYGSMKFVAGESFIVNSEDSSVNLSTAIYGNVLNSTGSIIPLIWDSINNNYPLTLYSDKMSRFMITIDEAIKLIEHSLEVNGYNIIPNIKSFLVKDLFEIYFEKFGLKYNLGVPRVSEKLHEMMISPEEVPRTYFDKNKNIYLMHYSKLADNPIKNEYVSDNSLITKKELEIILKQYNYFTP